MAPTDTDYSKTLYVIFHGAWAFVDNASDTQYIHAFAADVPEHVFMAGSWLAEKKIIRGSTLLLGGAFGEPDCNTGRCGCIRDPANAGGFVLFPPRQACTVGAYAEIRLPRPTRIWPELVVPGVDVTIPDGAMQSNNLGLVPVFEYKIPCGPPTLRLLPDDPQAPNFWCGDSPGEGLATTLHLFAADDDRKREQQQPDFEAAAKLLGFNATFNGCGKPASSDVVKTPGLQGGREFEVTTFLFQRVWALREIGVQMQNGNLKDLYWDMSAGPSPCEAADGRSTHHRVTATTAELSTCGGGGGGS